MDHPTSDDFLTEAKEILLNVSIPSHTSLQILDVLDNQLEPKIAQLRESVISDLRTEAAARRNGRQMMRGVAPPPLPPPPESGQKRKDLEPAPSTHSDPPHRQEKMKGVALPPPPSPPGRGVPPTYSDTISAEGSKFPSDRLPWKPPSRWVSDNIRKRFYKCKKDGCPASKYICDSTTIPGKFDVTYKHYHTCGIHMFGVKPGPPVQTPSVQTTHQGSTTTTGPLVQTPSVQTTHQGSISTTGPPVQMPSIQTTHQGSSTTTRPPVQTPSVQTTHQGSTTTTGPPVQTPSVQTTHQGSTTTTGPPVQTPSVQTTHQGSSTTTGPPVQTPSVQTTHQGSNTTIGPPVQTPSVQTTHQGSTTTTGPPVQTPSVQTTHQGSSTTTGPPVQTPLVQPDHQSSNTLAINQGSHARGETVIDGSTMLGDGAFYQGSRFRFAPAASNAGMLGDVAFLPFYQGGTAGSNGTLFLTLYSKNNYLCYFLMFNYISVLVKVRLTSADSLTKSTNLIMRKCHKWSMWFVIFVFCPLGLFSLQLVFAFFIARSPWH
uniref:formin-like protein 3 n=1 Tax=Erigeron canadensis TaxID=72917 RepID=UPI001CB91042|nr:formin-like protein 3 [Erigeron canadensis]